MALPHSAQLIFGFVEKESCMAKRMPFMRGNGDLDARQETPNKSRKNGQKGNAHGRARSAEIHRLFQGMNAGICRARGCFRQIKAPQKIPEGFLFLLSAMNAGA
ncbi:MAG: hypothetical protein IJC63_01345 [Myxococcaceae bacterium]|nr:hypothetical protein [Myxococcaceae bacterium]MBR2979960.1 hypothetical protein [Myxococcaceae bacterium]